MGFEPTTPTLARLCSTPELRPHPKAASKPMSDGAQGRFTAQLRRAIHVVQPAKSQRCSAAMSENVNHGSQDANEQIAQLREQVQTLMSDRVAPVLSQAADTAQHYATQARDIVEDQSEALSERVREAPIVAILLAALCGYIFGRIAR